MSSYDKGNDFELKVFNGFKRIIEQGEMPGVSRHYNIFHKKKYKSIDSNATLHPDITIEVYLFIDSQRCNRADSDYVIGHLSQDFSVSKDVVKIRMQNLGLLEYGSDTPKRVREIIW